MTSSLNEGGTAVFRPSLVSLSFFQHLLPEILSNKRKAFLWICRRKLMKSYLVKQKFRLGGERFDIKNDLGMVEYHVEGSFFKIPKTFTIYDVAGEQVSEISKEVLTFLPRFKIQLSNGDSFYIRKKLTFWKDKYEFDNLGLRIEGNVWDLNFKLLDNRDQVIAEITKELFHLTSTYTVTVYEDSYADLVISLCVAIDYVEMLERDSN